MLAGIAFVSGQSTEGSDPGPAPPELAALPPLPATDSGEPADGRVLGVIPDNKIVPAAAAHQPLTTRGKFNLAFKDSIDPFTFASAGFYAGISQWHHDDAAYGLGAGGYSKRFAAAYGDQIIGNYFTEAMFPALLHQDPRYFRKGTGSFKSRFFYATASTFRCKGDNGKWQPNVSNLLGNLAAGGIANLYYPQTDRGAGLTFQRGFTVTLEGVFGGLGYEFWPDVSRKLFHRNKTDPSLSVSTTP